MLLGNFNEDRAAWSVESFDVGCLLRRLRASCLHQHDAGTLPIPIFENTRPWSAIAEMRMTGVNA